MSINTKAAKKFTVVGVDISNKQKKTVLYSTSAAQASMAFTNRNPKFVVIDVRA